MLHFQNPDYQKQKRKRPSDTEVVGDYPETSQQNICIKVEKQWNNRTKKKTIVTKKTIFCYVAKVVLVGDIAKDLVAKSYTKIAEPQNN
jgi:hypothetical protein